MYNSTIINEASKRLNSIGIPHTTGNGADILIHCELIDASWSTGKKTITYDASVLINDMDHMIYMWEKTSESSSGFSFGSDSEMSFQSGTTLFRKVKSVQYGPDGQAYEYTLDLGAITKAIKDTAAGFGFGFKTVLNREKAQYPAGFVPPVAPPSGQSPAEPQAGESFCAYCGTKINAGDRFCMSCGKPAPGNEAAPPVFASAPQQAPMYQNPQAPMYQNPHQYAPYSGAELSQRSKKINNAVIFSVIGVVVIGILISVGFLIKGLLSDDKKTDNSSAVVSGQDVEVSQSPAVSERVLTDSSVVSKGVSKDDLGNVLNGQYYFTSGDYAYYSSFDANCCAHIYKMNLTDSTVSIIFDGFGWSLVVIDDWLYFSGNQGATIDDTYNLFRIKTDGSELQNLNTGYCYGMFTYHDLLYYGKMTSSDSNDYAVYSSNLDGTNEQLVASNCFGPIIFENMLYYLDNSNNLCRSKPDGTGVTVLVAGNASIFTIGNGKIVFADINSNLYVCNVDGTEQTLIRQVGSYSIVKINSFEGKIFFAESDGIFIDEYYGYSYWLSSINFDGTEEASFYSTVSYGAYINVIDNKVYIMNYTMDPVTYNMPAVTCRMNFDGSSFEELPR